MHFASSVATPSCEGGSAIPNHPSLLLYWANLEQFFRFPSEQKAENFRKFEFDDVAADCVLASTVVFAKPPYKCDWLELYQFDCCRACNAQFEKCNEDVRRIPGGPEFCYRKQYKCQCDCLNKHRPVENSEQIKP